MKEQIEILVVELQPIVNGITALVCAAVGLLAFLIAYPPRGACKDSAAISGLVLAAIDNCSGLSYTNLGLYMTETLAKGSKIAGHVVAYYRVSTDRQKRSGLGLEAQRKAVRDYLNGGKWRLSGEFTEVESGRKDDRPQLDEALRRCRQLGATLVIAKLDRLARNVHFISGLMDKKVKFVATDMPHANEFTIHIMAAVAEQERKMISARTKEGLERAKARGVKLGRHGHILARANAAAARLQARRLKPIILKAQREGKRSIRAIMTELNTCGIKTSRGGTWHPHTVNVLLKRIEVRC